MRGAEHLEGWPLFVSPSWARRTVRRWTPTLTFGSRASSVVLGEALSTGYRQRGPVLGLECV